MLTPERIATLRQLSAAFPDDHYVGYGINGLHGFTHGELRDLLDAAAGRPSLQDAIRVLLHEEHVGDYIYRVRERAASDPNFVGNTWDHPRVTRFAEALTRLAEEVATPGRDADIRKGRPS